jgi:hypothetical protein
MMDEQPCHRVQPPKQSVAVAIGLIALDEPTICLRGRAFWDIFPIVEIELFAEHVQVAR